MRHFKGTKSITFVDEREKLRMAKDQNSKTEKLVDAIVEGIQEVKGQQIVTLDLRNITHAVTDFFVVCHANSNTQVDAIARSVAFETEKQLNEKPWRKEGVSNAEWVLLDYTNVVVHVFYKEKRSYFGLEELWADAEITQVPELA